MKNVCKAMFGSWIWWREQKRIKRTFTKHTASEMRSGYSSRTLEISNVPIPAPVPPPREWQSWKPCRPHLLSVKPERATAFFTLTVFYSTYFRILEKKRSLKQLFGKMAVTTILFKTSISRIPLLLFGQHQVPSQLTQHLRCSDPDRFFN